jgi:hypothetical protein
MLKDPFDDQQLFEPTMREGFGLKHFSHATDRNLVDQEVPAEGYGLKRRQRSGAPWLVSRIGRLSG